VVEFSAIHSSALGLVKHTRDLVRTGGLQLQGEEDLRTTRDIVPVYELPGGMYDCVKSKEAEEG
jgi:hypothetical protein